MPKYRIGFANFPGDGKTAWQTSAWCTKVFLKMKEDPHVEGIVPLYYGSDTPICMLRNRCVKDAIEAQCDYLLMIDSDIVPDVDYGTDPLAQPFWTTAWKFLMDRRAKLSGSQMPATIAAPYCGPPPHENPYVFRWKNHETGSPNMEYRLEMLEREDASFRSGIEEVAALPTGLILYDTRVFDLLPRPWFDYEWTDEYETRKASTEDVYQTRNASLVGCPQFVAWDCWAGHIKTKIVGKPRPLTTECIAENMHQAILKGRSISRRLTFVGDPEGNGAPEGARRDEAVRRHAVPARTDLFRAGGEDRPRGGAALDRQRVPPPGPDL